MAATLSELASEYEKPCRTCWKFGTLNDSHTDCYVCGPHKMKHETSKPTDPPNSSMRDWIFDVPGFGDDRPTKTAPQGIGNIHSTEKGSAARYNIGKAPMHLVHVKTMARSLRRSIPLGESKAHEQARWAANALECLGEWQESGDPESLFDCLDMMVPMDIGIDGWEEAAHVLDFGLGKYGPWNWAKGFDWSVPFGSAVRHLMKLIRLEGQDTESKRTHQGHAFCNVMMLLVFAVHYTDGDDRPRSFQEIHDAKAA